MTPRYLREKLQRLGLAMPLHVAVSYEEALRREAAALRRKRALLAIAAGRTPGNIGRPITRTDPRAVRDRERNLRKYHERKAQQ